MHHLDWIFILDVSKQVISGLLMILGALAIVAKHSKFDPDEKVIEMIEQVLKYLLMALPTVITIISSGQKTKKDSNGHETTPES